MMRRRDFIAGLGGVVPSAVVARAQQPAMPVVGWLDSTAASTTNRLTAFRQGLSAAGFVEGRNVSIEYRFAEDQINRLPALAADLVGKRVAAIVTNNIATAAAKAATSTTDRFCHRRRSGREWPRHQPKPARW
jgi:putative ABC transport system substrate-binding protein